MRKTSLNHFSVKLISFISIFFLLLIIGYSQIVLSLGSISVDSVGDRTRIASTVTDEEGNPLPGVTVTLINEFGISRMVITDANGRFQFYVDRLFWTKKMKIKVELGGFSTLTSSIDIPYPPAPHPRKPEKPPQPDKSPCDIQEVVLKNNEGITFRDGNVIHNIKEVSFDICFKGKKFYVTRRKGGIATVGDQGNKSLCDINYPLYGYCDNVKIIKNHVYLYESYTDDTLAEIRVKSFEKFIEVRIAFHVRRNEEL